MTKEPQNTTPLAKRVARSFPGNIFVPKKIWFNKFLYRSRRGRSISSLVTITILFIMFGSSTTMIWTIETSSFLIDSRFEPFILVRVSRSRWRSTRFVNKGNRSRFRVIYVNSSSINFVNDPTVAIRMVTM